MICFVIPAFNEVNNIPALLADLIPRARDLQGRVIIVDDGSTDGTYEAIERHRQDYPITVVRHSRNRGIGAAVDSGVRVALSSAGDDDPIVTLEADATSDLDDLGAMLSRFDEGHDVVLASFFAPGGRLVGVNRLRIAMSRTLAICLRVLTRLKDIHTFSYLYRVYRARALRDVVEIYGHPITREPGFPAAVELLLKVNRSGASITEVPSINDWNRRRGPSKLRVVPVLLAYMRLALNYLRESARGGRRLRSKSSSQPPRGDVVEILGEVPSGSPSR